MEGLSIRNFPTTTDRKNTNNKNTFAHLYISGPTKFNIFLKNVKIYQIPKFCQIDHVSQPIESVF